MVEALDTVEVALVDRIDAQEAWSAFRVGFAALADGDLDGPGLVHVAALAPVGRRAPEVVQVARAEQEQKKYSLVALAGGVLVAVIIVASKP